MTQIPNLPKQILVQGSIPEAFDRSLLGVIIVDHGSRRDESNIYVKETAHVQNRFDEELANEYISAITLYLQFAQYFLVTQFSFWYF